MSSTAKGSHGRVDLQMDQLPLHIQFQLQMSDSYVHGPTQDIFYFQIAFCIPELLKIGILAFIFTNNFTNNFLKYLRREHMQYALYIF